MKNTLILKFSSTIYKERVALILVAVSGAVLRFMYLGYSEFQGDEIKALYTGGQTLFNFLSSQRKGPIEFLVTYLIKLVTGGNSEFITRLPFAVAGFVSIFLLYFLIRDLYGKRVALVASLLFSFNGLFVAFSRIAQYQSFTYFFYLLSLYLFLKLKQSNKIIFLYLGFISWGLGVLSHYDSVFILLPVAYCIFFWLRSGGFKQKILHLIMGTLMLIALVALFYLPIYLNPTFFQTKSYLLTRLSGGKEKVSSDIITLRLYSPFLFILLVPLFAFVGILFGRLKLIFSFLWFTPPFIALYFLVSVPGTHIYNYIIPMLVISAYGMVFLWDKLSNTILRYVYLVFILLCLSFLFYQSYYLFVEHSIEYPWQEKNVLFWKAKMPPEFYHLSIFGFPYNRNLKEVNAFVQQYKNIDSVASNEGSKLIRYYIKPKPVVYSKNETNMYAYLYVYNAQSRKFTKTAKASALNPVATFSKDGKPLVDLYLIEYL